jgi:hypothetical protein
MKEETIALEMRLFVILKVMVKRILLSGVRVTNGWNGTEGISLPPLPGDYSSFYRASWTGYRSQSIEFDNV